ncbi:MAG: pteridine reductase [Gammaproteobacteria bacterium]|nr:pteridine reductase [Gammaproteobacteria bacterium]MBL7000113.1 pteridine reductase [Gammaproteobacteria bacterium]
MKLAGKTALITGAARRLGAQSAKTLHQNGANIIIHYGHSSDAAETLVKTLNAVRADSATAVQADLLQLSQIERLAEQAIQTFDGLDILVNNASSFYPTPLGEIQLHQFDDLIGSNFKAPLFLSQACYPALKKSAGCIINMVDIHARSPLKDHTVYSCAKAANAMLTRSLALEMGPQVRVNGIAPGAILWPQNHAEMDSTGQQQILQQIPLRRTGAPGDIADTLLFLIESDYINGQIIAVDGGRQLF